MEISPKKLLYYVDAKGLAPCLDWLNNLRDAKGRAVIRARLTRLEQGNMGNCRTVGQGVHEMKIDFGPGYRVYFGNDGPGEIILLGGGDKSTQTSDIEEALFRWSDYNA